MLSYLNFSHSEALCKKYVVPRGAQRTTIRKTKLLSAVERKHSESLSKQQSEQRRWARHNLRSSTFYTKPHSEQTHPPNCFAQKLIE